MDQDDLTRAREQLYLCYFRTWIRVGDRNYRTVSRTTSKDFIQWSDPVEMGFGLRCTRPIGYAGYVKWFGHVFPFRTKTVRNIGFEFFNRD